MERRQNMLCDGSVAARLKRQATAELASNEFLVLVLCAAAVLYYGFYFDLTLFDEAIRALR